MREECNVNTMSTMKNATKEVARASIATKLVSKQTSATHLHVRGLKVLGTTRGVVTRPTAIRV